MSAESNPNKPDLSNLRPTVIDFGAKGAGPKTADKAGPSQTAPGAGRAWRPWEVYAGFALMMVAVQVALGPKIRLSQWGMNAESNAAVAEGIAWTKGRLDIPPVRHHELQWSEPAGGIDVADPMNRLHDTAVNPADGKVYNVFPPMFSMLTFALAPVHALLGMPEGMWRPEFMALLVFWPIMIATFVVFYRRIGNPLWAAALGFAYIGGTALLPNLGESGQGFLGQLDHSVSQIGLLILAADVLGRQRIWPSLIGLAIAAYTRQMTSLYGLVILWIAYRHYGWKGAGFSALGLAVVAAPLMTLNYLKLGNPLDFGYRHIYVGRNDEYMGDRCREYGTFSPKFIFGVDGGHGNLYYMHLAPPAVGTVSLIDVNIHDSNQNGTSLWITTPLAFWVLIAAGSWWRERGARALMLGTIPVLIGLAMYHSPGYMEHGYNRFALDFLPLWLVVVAPYAIGGRRDWRSWLTAAFAAWGLLYFNQVVPEARMNLAAASAAVETVTHGQV